MSAVLRENKKNHKWRIKKWKCCFFYGRISHVASIEASDFGMEKYPRGRRGGFAKALGGVTAARGFDSLLLRQDP